MARSLRPISGRSGVVASLVALGLLAGCGSSSSHNASAPTPGPPSTGASTAPASAGPKALSVTETEFKLGPSAANAAAGKVTVTVRNAGATVHALEIENGGPGGKDLRSPTIRPGSVATITAQLKAGKTYEWYCPIANHRALGMKGKLTVGPASSGGGGATSGASTAGGGGY